MSKYKSMLDDYNRIGIVGNYPCRRLKEKYDELSEDDKKSYDNHPKEAIQHYESKMSGIKAINRKINFINKYLKYITIILLLFLIFQIISTIILFSY